MTPVVWGGSEGANGLQQGISMGGPTVPPSEYPAKSGNIFCCHSLGRRQGITGIYCVEARNPAHHPTVHRTAPLDNKELSGPRYQVPSFNNPGV